MQTFNIDIGKTKAELLAITEKTDLGEVTYDPAKKLIYQNEWQTIVPNTVLKPEVDGESLNYMYGDTVLTKSEKYCAQLFWKAGLIITDGTTSDMATPGVVLNSTKKYIGGVNFNIESGLVDSIFYTKGKVDSFSGGSSKSFAISEELSQILDTSDILKTLKKLPGLQKCTPVLGTNYLYSGTKSYNSGELNVKWGFNIVSETSEKFTTGTPLSIIFGQQLTGHATLSSLITVNDNDTDNIRLIYSQPENNTDQPRFYDFAIGTVASSTLPYINNFPQALPIGVPIVIAPAFTTTNTDAKTNLKTLITPFIFYMLGITEVPEE